MRKKQTNARKRQPTGRSQSCPRITLPAPYMNDSYDALCDAFLSLKTRDEMRAFVRDLCTEQEIEEMTNRFTVARMLANKTPYLTVEQKTGMSSATIARVNQWLCGGMGGYRIALGRTKKAGRNSDPHHSTTLARRGV